MSVDLCWEYKHDRIRPYSTLRFVSTMQSHVRKIIRILVQQPLQKHAIVIRVVCIEESRPMTDRSRMSAGV